MTRIDLAAAIRPALMTRIDDPHRSVPQLLEIVLDDIKEIEDLEAVVSRFRV
jgi:hypothetical protein